MTSAEGRHYVLLNSALTQKLKIVATKSRRPRRRIGLPHDRSISKKISITTWPSSSSCLRGDAFEFRIHLSVSRAILASVPYVPARRTLRTSEKRANVLRSTRAPGGLHPSRRPRVLATARRAGDGRQRCS